MNGAEASAVQAVGAQVQAMETAWAQPSAPSAPSAPWADASPSGGTFASFITQGVDKVNASMLRADAAIAQAAVDGSQPPHQVLLALEEARLSFQLALQVRNRLLEGYQELMRMQT